MKIAMMLVLIIQAVEFGCWMPNTDNHGQAAINVLKVLVVGSIAAYWLFQ